MSWSLRSPNTCCLLVFLSVACSMWHGVKNSKISGFCSNRNFVKIKCGNMGVCVMVESLDTCQFLLHNSMEESLHYQAYMQNLSRSTIISPASGCMVSQKQHYCTFSQKLFSSYLHESKKKHSDSLLWRIFKYHHLKSFFCLNNCLKSRENHPQNNIFSIQAPPKGVLFRVMMQQWSLCFLITYT